jgi:phage terminase small subunit
MTPKQERFVLEYLVDANATQASIRAGYSAKTAHAIGSKLIRNPAIAEAIRARRGKMDRKTELTVEKLDTKLAQILDFDPRALLREDGSLKPPSEWDDSTAAVIAGLDVEELFEGRGDDREQVGNVRKVKIADRIKPIELGYKRLGVLREQTALTVGALTIVIQE